MKITIRKMEVTKSNIDEMSDVLNEMIDVYAKETEEYIPNIITDVAHFYSIDRKILVHALKKINSIYTANNNVVFYQNGKPTKRTAYSCAQRTLLIKIGKKLKNIYSGIENGSMMYVDHMNLILNN